MKKIFAGATFALMLLMNVWYCYLSIKGYISPTLMTWVMFCVAVSLSFSTYWSTSKHDLLSNISNTGDTFLVFIVTVVVIFWGKNTRFDINTFEVVCILLSLIILIFWRITKAHKTSNLLLQGIMIIAYFPTFYHLWYATTTSESITTWSITWLAALLGVITGVLGKDKLAIVYSARSLIMVSILLILILRIM